MRGHVAMPSVGLERRKLLRAPGSIARGILTTRSDRRNPQPSPKSSFLHRRRYGCSSQTRCRSGACMHACTLRYSRTPPRGGLTEEARLLCLPIEGGKGEGGEPCGARGEVASIERSSGGASILKGVRGCLPRRVRSLVAGSLRSFPQDSWSSISFIR